MARRPELADEITSRQTNAAYLPDAELPASLGATPDVEKAVDRANAAVIAVSSHAFREVFREVAPHLGPLTVMVSLTKGIEQETLKRITEVMAEEAGLEPASRGGARARTEAGRHRGRHEHGGLGGQDEPADPGSAGRQRVDVPICEHVVKVLYEGVSPARHGVVARAPLGQAGAPRDRRPELSH